jgi:hypothetical protein
MEFGDEPSGSSKCFTSGCLSNSAQLHRVGQIQVAEDSDQLRIVANTGMNLLVPLSSAKSLNGWATVRFARRTNSGILTTWFSNHKYEFYLLGYKSVYCLESQRCFHEDTVFGLL